MKELRPIGNYQPIAKTAREIFQTGSPSGGYISVEYPEELITDAVPELQHLHDVVGRKERLGAEAVVIKHFIDESLTMRSSFPPFGLLEWNKDQRVPIVEIPDTFPFDYLSEAFENMLTFVTLQERGKLAKHPEKFTPELQKAFLIHKKWEKLLAVGVKRIALESGIRTAVATSIDILRYVPLTLQDTNMNPSSENAKNLAGTGFILLKEMANLDVHSFRTLFHLIDEVKKEGRNPYTLHPTPQGQRIMFSKRVLSGLNNVQNARVNTDATYNGCPAGVNLDGESSIKNLWDWILEVSSTVYEKALTPGEVADARSSLFHS